MKIFKIISYIKNRIKNFFYNNLGIRFSPKLLDFPPMIMIDTTTRCNLACNHCPNSTLSKDKNWGGDMDFDLYKKIIDEIAKENPKITVRPFNSGEPLVRGDMEKMITYAKRKRIKNVSINTNGVLLTEKRALNILNAKLDHIEFSVDAFSRETFIKIKNMDLYERVIENIERLIDLKNKTHSKIRISVSFVKQKDNYHEVKDFYNYWKNKIDLVTIREYHQHGNLVDEHGNYKESKIKYRQPCPYLWDRMIIEYNGKVRFCEADWKVQYPIGNIRNQTVREIWNSDVYNEIRSSHIHGTFSHPFCKECKDWKIIQ